MPEEDLRDKIKNEILKSGFPLEIFCQQLILDNQWEIVMNKQYLDKDGNYREIDIEAYRQDLLDGDLRLSTSIIIECKKNHSNPWVFFREKTRGPILNLAISGDIGDKSKEVFFWRYHHTEKVLEHHYKTSANKSRDYVLPFKHENPRENRQIYESVTSVIDYFKHHGLAERRTFDRNHVHLNYLVVVFDGRLFMADVIDSHDVQVEETNHVLLGVSNIDGSRTRHFAVDIVTKDFFSEYLGILEKNRLLTVEYILSIRDKELNEDLIR